MRTKNASGNILYESVDNKGGVDELANQRHKMVLGQSEVFEARPPTLPTYSEKTEKTGKHLRPTVQRAS